MTKTGKCLCGSVTVTAEVKSENFDACHCGMCRKWGGGPALSVDVRSYTIFKGEEEIGIYNSSEWAERGFCKNCGTHLFYRLKNSDYCNFPLALLENIDHFHFHKEVFIDAKPPNYEFANPTKKMTEAEVLASFVPPPQ